MENSIEEDIKILESIIKINNDYLKGIENQTINQKEIKAIEHILSDYKRVSKENEQLRTEVNSLRKENEELKYKIKGQECVIETQVHNEEVYESIFEKLEKENKELKKQVKSDVNTIF